MSLERFNYRSLADVRNERLERREIERSIKASREFYKRKTQGKLATAYCTDQADAQALINFAETHNFYLSKVLRESDKLTKPFDQRHTSQSLCEFLSNKCADHVILASSEVFADFHDFAAFVWLCRKAHVQIHFLRSQPLRFAWRLTFNLFS